MSYSFTFNRPLSPHIVIYKLNFILLRSILHRISGLVLSLIFVILIVLNEVVTNSNFMFLSFFFWNYIAFVFFLIIKNLFLSFFFYHTISGLFHFYTNVIRNYDFFSVH
uniref:Succinate:cytochrome c oxidoreductase subunit 3 n=1 Tax=Montagnia macrospora TaxID=2662032 RepID=A0A343UXT2_9FLOR|nr:succinate:cytochrome c oxidoreductase subunit 3 [Montagnia macrospora]AVK39489.1 succinate:cytochrome c oxidoreductase subunit 3 [Montagnia macrospora]